MSFTLNYQTLQIEVTYPDSPADAIISTPPSGEYKIKELRLDASKKIVVVYDETPEA